MIHLILAGLISISVSPTVCNAPCSIRVTLKVEPAEDNERVILEIDGDNYSRVSDMDYSNGGPKTVQIWYKDLPGGDYEIRASLHKHDGKSWVAGSDKKNIKIAD
jgi:hypothetical protein